MGGLSVSRRDTTVLCTDRVLWDRAMSRLLTALLLFCLLCFQARGHNDCLPAKLRENLDAKRDPTERILLLAKIGERQSSELLHARSPLPEHSPLPKERSLRAIWDLHDCAWSELLEELWDWKPQGKRDKNAIQEMLLRAKRDQEHLHEFEKQWSGNNLPVTQKSLQEVQEVEARLQVLCNRNVH